MSLYLAVLRFFSFDKPHKSMFFLRMLFIRGVHKLCMLSTVNAYMLFAFNFFIPVGTNTQNTLNGIFVVVVVVFDADLFIKKCSN